jgi:hypothetical protein
VRPAPNNTLNVSAATHEMVAPVPKEVAFVNTKLGSVVEKVEVASGLLNASVKSLPVGPSYALMREEVMEQP